MPALRCSRMRLELREGKKYLVINDELCGKRNKG